MKDVGVIVQSLDNSPPSDRLVPRVPLSHYGRQNVSGPRIHIGPTSPQPRRKQRSDAETQLHSGLVWQAHWQPRPRWTRLMCILGISPLNRCYAVVTCEIELFQNYFNLRRCPSEIMLFQRVETCLKLFRNYFRGLLQLVNIFQHVRCRWNDSEIFSKLFQWLK